MNWGTWLFADYLEEVKDYPPYLDHPKQYKPQTNADRIRAMSDEELSVWLMRLHTICECCSVMEECETIKCDVVCRQHIEEWLKQPAKDGDNE